MAILRHSESASKKRTRIGGFTLIELIIVMGIVAVLSTMLIGYSRQSSKNLMLTSTEAKVLSLVSRAKFLSIETFLSQLDKPLDPTERICAYGVHSDKDVQEVFIFQKRSALGDCGSITNVYVDGEDVKLTSDLDSVKIDTKIMLLSGDLDNVVFIPPDPDVVINGNEFTTDAKIEIGLKDSPATFTVNVNNAGQVSTK